MAWRIVKQPNGLYARWSDVVDGFTHFGLTQAAALQLCRCYRGMGRAEAEEKVSNADLEPGRWRECLAALMAADHDAYTEAVKHGGPSRLE